MHVDAGVPGNVRQGYHRREETRLALAFRVRVRPGRSGIYASRRGNARISRASVCGTTPRYRTSRKMVSRIVDRYRERRAMRTCQIVLPGMSTGQHRASSHDSAHSRGHPHQTARQNQDGAVRLAEKQKMNGRPVLGTWQSALYFKNDILREAGLYLFLNSVTYPFSTSHPTPDIPAVPVPECLRLQQGSFAHHPMGRERLYEINSIVTYPFPAAVPRSVIDVELYDPPPPPPLL